MKGYKDKDKKFHPIETRKKRSPSKKSRYKKQKFDKSKIQSLIFNKKKFSITEAKEWAFDHGYKAVKVEPTKNTWRIRQFSPNKIKKGGECRTIQFGGSGVQGVLCEVPLKFKRSARYKAVARSNKIRTVYRNGKVYHVASSGVDIHHPEKVWCMLCDRR